MELDGVMRLAENQYFIRNEMKIMELTAFIADNSVLPRKSGISQQPLENAVVVHKTDNELPDILPEYQALYQKNKKKP